MAPSTVVENISDESEDRRLLALNAAWEIESLMCALAREIDQDADKLHIRGMVLRTRQLSQLVMSSLDEPDFSLKTLEYEVRGIWPLSAMTEVQRG